MKIDLNFILKWSATVVLIIGTAFNSLNMFPLGPMILVFGGFLWLVVAIRWREPSLIVTNAVMLSVGVGGLLFYYLF